MAAGLPLITLIGKPLWLAGGLWRHRHGRRFQFLLLALGAAAGLIGARVDPLTWTDLGRNRAIVVLLLITALQMSGQFVVFTFMGPLLAKLTHVGPEAVGLVFAIYGVCGFVGVVIATRIVDSWGAYKTSVLFTVLLLTGVTGWALSAGVYPLMACSVAVWGLGFASSNSMQQVRWSARRLRWRRHRCRSIRRCSMSGRPLVRRSAACCMRAIFLYGAGYASMGFVALALMVVISTAVSATRETEPRTGLSAGGDIGAACRDPRQRRR